MRQRVRHSFFGLMTVAALSAGLVGPAWSCGPGQKPNTPALGAALTKTQVAAHPSAEERAMIATLEREMRKAQAEGRETEARAAEEQAMKILGYRKAWLGCGPGTFFWMKAKAA